MSEEKDCRMCVYFSGKPSKDPRWVWSSCKAGVQNLVLDSAKRCRHFASSISEALEFVKKEHCKRMGWTPLRCPYCGAEMKKRG